MVSVQDYFESVVIQIIRHFINFLIKQPSRSFFSVHVTPEMYVNLLPLVKLHTFLRACVF